MTDFYAPDAVSLRQAKRLRLLAKLITRVRSQPPSRDEKIFAVATLAHSQSLLMEAYKVTAGEVADFLKNEKWKDL